MEYQVKLEKFEGPLDLLLYLIKKQEINIYDIPIAKITEQYLEYLKLMQFLNLELAGEFLLMAASLMRIKARMLLPRQEEGDEEVVDPRSQLVQQLLEYQKFKSAASKLEAMEFQRRMLFSRPETDGKQEVDEYSYNLFDLVTAFKAVLERNRVKYLEVEVEESSIEEKIELLKEKIRSSKRIAFDDLFKGKQSLVDLIVTFLALLEVLRLRIATVRQTKPFGRIWIKASEGN